MIMTIAMATFSTRTVVLKVVFLGHPVYSLPVGSAFGVEWLLLTGVDIEQVEPGGDSSI